MGQMWEIRKRRFSGKWRRVRTFDISMDMMEYGVELWD